MVRRIFGKSWSSANPSSSASATSSIGIAKSNPDLFGDLVGSALNQGKGSSNVPLKAAAPAKNLYSMGSLKDSLPKSNNNGSSSVNSMKNSQGSVDNFANFGDFSPLNQSSKPVLEDDSSNVAVLLQRALLYESTEKYKLGAEDLRTVLKIDPANRLAKSTIHRLNKMAG
ncbi:uncharacterized protein A4U43_C07F14120 [Asparagus officinalis]|uniref:Uncharacterized protein n=1 Tax=Asparagus officinalis TaxID=4686 RepID=A0A5P1EBV8_ASPOF|nr:uncharacterized protein A4U43_C07F14120 [Asparagus officinalis]